MRRKGVPEGYFPDWDVKDKNGTTYEVKTDYLWRKTKNVAVEYNAVRHSKAQFFVYKLAGGKGMYLLHSWQLKTFLRHYPIVRGGQFGDSMALVPLKEFLSVASKVITKQYK